MKSFAWIVVLLVARNFVSMAQTESSGKEDSLQKAKPIDSFYNQNSSSKWWIRELKNIIIISPKTDLPVDSFNLQSPSNIYIDVEGRTITNIRIIRLKPFGASVTDSVMRDVNWLSKVGNATHVNTREFIIRNALLFREGDQVNSYWLADTERYLRSLRYINDARVAAFPISDDEAEIVVVVQDIFPYSASAATDMQTNGNLGIASRNIIGLGIEMRAKAFIDSNKDHLMGYEASLRIQNIGRSFVYSQADYMDKYENQRYGFTLRRDFYAPTTQYAGHLTYYVAQTPVRYYDPEGKSRKGPIDTIKYRHTNVWLGRSFQLNKNPLNRQRKNITASLGIQDMYFVKRPEESSEYYYWFQDRTTCLASLTYSQQAYYKASMIYSFGRTEDIPYGYQLSLIGGKEFNEKHNRPYIGTNLSSGYFIPKLGYLSGAFSYGTFFNDGAAEQGIVNLEMNYFTNLQVVGNSRLRTFVKGKYTQQLFHRTEDRLAIDGEHGIPGFSGDSIFGRHRINLSIEQNFFAPWNLLGFQFVVYAFTYLSWLGDKPDITLSHLYSSFGLGVRIRNNRLIFDTLQLQFAYFPNIPKNSSFRYFHHSSESVLQPRNFMPKAPEVMPLY